MSFLTWSGDGVILIKMVEDELPRGHGFFKVLFLSLVAPFFHDIADPLSSSKIGHFSEIYPKSPFFRIEKSARRHDQSGKEDWAKTLGWHLLRFYWFYWVNTFLLGLTRKVKKIRPGKNGCEAGGKTVHRGLLPRWLQRNFSMIVTMMLTSAF